MQNESLNGFSAVIYAPDDAPANEVPARQCKACEDFSANGMSTLLMPNKIDVSSLKCKLSGAFFAVPSSCEIDLDYDKIYSQHKNSGNTVTMVCALQNIEIPHATVELDNAGAIKSINNRPKFTFLIETGIYVIEPEVLQLAPADEKISIRALVRLCLHSGKKVRTFLVRDVAI